MLAPVISFLIAVAFWPGIAGAATSPRWALVALSLYFLSPWCLPFVAWCFWKLDFDQAVHWAILCGALSWGFRYDTGSGTNARSPPFGGCDAVIRGFSIGIGMSSVLAIAQVMGFKGLPQAISPAGLFVNKNIMGEAAAVAFAAGLLARRPLGGPAPWLNIVRYWWPTLMTLPAIVLSGARAAQIASFTAFWLWLPWRWRLLAGGLVFVLLPFVWPTMFAPHIGSLAQRMYLWNDALRALTPWGNGSYDFSNYAVREPYLHNDWLQFVFELGWVGVVPVLGVVYLGVFYPVFCVSFIIVASFGFPLHMPASGWFAAFVFGYCLRNCVDGGRELARVRDEEPRLRGSGRRETPLPVSALHRSRPRSKRVVSRLGKSGA